MGVGDASQKIFRRHPAGSTNFPFAVVDFARINNDALCLEKPPLAKRTRRGRFQKL